MATCSTQDLINAAPGFAALMPGMIYPAKLALLCRILLQVDPSADCSITGLMRKASCFSGVPPGFYGPLQTELLCRILNLN